MGNTDNEVLECWNKIIQNDDLKALERLFYLLHDKFVRFCLHYVKSKEVAEEIVSDVLTDCWMDRAQLKAILKPEVYLLVAIKNRAICHWRKSAGMQIVDLHDTCADLTSQYRPDLQLEKKELMLNLDKAIDSLPIQCKTIFRLVKEEGMKCADVAEVLDISVRTVHTQVYRAMNKLSNSMDKYVNDERKAIIVNISSSFLSVSSILFFYFQCV
ncbi:sigma-70 family RNA polymerase sigma factor [Mucilaginibacter sabulilitoris]|uniref:Sigma-70 family RNA polymerase sigma factor n=1 Tax=Mucilaginibacter sabulilitoris TaxID=1173583 RepID=A0ABZ0TPM9_9SPHI|nr:sigma-70 family RNA polymerase sigma factor [Mucilaginibacter sabulilitoris]WPU93130.1 sigma-70 family RNA polymerase sigma factor [Mucilaginibacter sabulilitoris]